MPVYNGMSTIDLSLPALLAQQEAALGRDYEIIVVDDGSSDGSGDHIAQQYPQVGLTRHEKNLGRIEARRSGVKAAAFDYILLIDVRVVAAPDLLQTYWDIGTPSPCMAAGEAGRTRQSPLDRVFHCLRAAYYKPHDAPESETRMVITRENFLRARKGTTAIFLDRHAYLDSLPKRRDKMVNDDTRLFANMVKKGPLFRDVRLRITYLQRSSFSEEIPHLYERGIRFADYYLRPGGPYRRHVFILLAASLLGVAMFIWQPARTVLGLLLTLACICLWLARRPMDFVWLMLCLPVLLPTFAAGALTGMINTSRNPPDTAGKG